MPVLVDTLLRTPDGDFERLSSTTRWEGDPHHFAGAVVLSADGTELLTQHEWDDLDDLWPYLLQALVDCHETGAGETLWPDQPISFRVEKLQAGRLLVTVAFGETRRGITANEGELYAAFAAAGTEFFLQRPSLTGHSDEPGPGAHISARLADVASSALTAAALREKR